MVNNIAEFNHLFSAFQQVKENQGCAGVDGVTVEEFETELLKYLSMLSHDLQHNQYTPLPLLGENLRLDE